MYDPLDKALEVYGTGQDGRLEEDFQKPGSSWQASELAATPSPLAGGPAAVYNPEPKNLEVYAAGTDTQFQEAWWSPGPGWQAGQLPATPSPLTP